MYTELHNRAHEAYISEASRLSPHFWTILDNVADRWIANNKQGTLYDNFKEYGCPEEKILSKKTFFNSEYHNTDWAMNFLTAEDLTLWAEEHQLDIKTLNAYIGR